MAALKTGLDRNTAAALSYVLFFVSGLVFFILEKDPYVRFHSAQSVIVFFALFLFWGLLDMVRIFSGLIPLVSILVFTLWLILIYKAWLGEEWEVPLLGVYARKFAKKGIMN